MVCVPGSQQACYDGLPVTKDVGQCQSGTQTCVADGSGFGACIGQVLPAANEDCATLVDDDCDGVINEADAGCACVPGTSSACYDGPPGTENKGVCVAGQHTCAPDGKSFGACLGEVLPTPETCATPSDDDCNGVTNDQGAGCLCAPGSVVACYSGPPATQNVGQCKGGTQMCNGQGTGFGACTGEVLPAASESCATAVDDNCDGQVNEGCVVPVTYAGSVQPILQAHCAPCHTSGGSGGANLATSYASTQLASYYCPGKTKGACTLVRIQDGSMPQGKGCTGNSATDAANSACLTAAEQATMAAWISGGQLP